jgi:SAM-dependent methyltransferase
MFSFEEVGVMFKFDKAVRTALASVFSNSLPRLYSALDNPVWVPVQVAAYQLVAWRYIQTGDRILDVGFGLGYGLAIMASAMRCSLFGIEIDHRAVQHGQKLVQGNPRIVEVREYNGYDIPYSAGFFDVVVCVDVLEHVSDYARLLREMCRVAKRLVFISTPNRRPEHTRPDGRPKNFWHLREWSQEELSEILSSAMHGNFTRIEWNYINGPWSGPFSYSTVLLPTTQALSPALLI